MALALNQEQLHDAMRFGSGRDSDPNSLGKYGMGLKLASLSHARRLTVNYTSHEGGKRAALDINGIEKGWECEVLKTDGAAMQLDARGEPSIWRPAHADRLG